MAGTEISRPMLLFSAGVVSIAVTVAVYVVARGGAGTTLPPGRCDVSATVAASADPAERPIAIAREGSAAWIMLVSQRAGHSDGSVRARVVRLPDEGSSSVVYTGEAPSAEAVSGFTHTPDGPAFAIARGRDVTAYVLSPDGAVRERAFPRGESPSGRDAITPSLALATQRDGSLSALARWPTPYGALRINARDVRESEAYTPRRRDEFHAPDLAVAGAAVLLAQERHAGSFDDTPARSYVELAVMDATPAHPDTLATLTFERAGTSETRPRVALLDAGAVLLWRDDHGLVAAHVAAVGGRPWQARETMRVLDEAGAVTGEHDVSSAAGECGSLAAWRSGSAIAMRAFDVARGRAGDVLRVEAPVGELVAGQRPRVRVERSGERTFVAVDSAQGPRVYDVTVSSTCAITARPVTLPALAMGANMRLAGVAASPNMAVLAVTQTRPDASESAMVFVTVPAAQGVARLAPPRVTVPQGVSELTMFAGDVPVVVGHARGSVMLRRIEPAIDEPGEDLLLRAMRGEEIAVDASAARHRVWVADVAGDEETGFGAPRSVVVHSAIDTLEDGPRTEVRPAVVPHADFARVTLSAIAQGEAAWGVTWSAGVAGGCLPGAWASLRDDNDRAIAMRNAPGESPWPWALPLVPRAQRTCGDRVLSATWEGTRLAATITGERVGAQLAVGDVMRAEVRLRALDERHGAHPRMASVARAGTGLLAVWLDGNALSPSLRYRMFSREGAPRTEVVALGDVTEAPGDARPDDVMPLAGEGAGFVTVFRTVHGPRVARLSCGAVP